VFLVYLGMFFTSFLSEPQTTRLDSAYSHDAQ
jgi:hypothetical protein